MTEQTSKQRSRPRFINSHYVLRLLAVVLLLALSVKYKEVGLEATRPFHNVTIALLGLAGLYCGVARLPIRFHFHPISILLYLGAGYLFFADALAGERGFKDGVYLIANSVAVYWLLAAVVEALTMDRFLSEATLVARLLGVVVALPTLIIWVWPAAGLGIIEPSPSYLARAHGLLGDPTNFGCFCAAALLFVAARSSALPDPPSWSGDPLNQVVMAIMMLGVIASGSRMAMLGGATGFALLLVFRQLRWKAVLVAAPTGVLLYPALLYLKARELNYLGTDIPSGDAPSIEVTSTGSPTVAENEAVMAQLAQGAFRIEEGGSEARLGLLDFGISTFRSLPIHEKFLGCGYTCIESLGRSSHIGYLDMLVNYGLVFLTVLVGLLLAATIASIWLAKHGGAIPLALLGLFITTTAFLSWPFNSFFNYPFFCALVSLACLAAFCRSPVPGYLRHIEENRSMARVLLGAVGPKLTPR